MNALDPRLVDHALVLAEEYLRDTRPTILPVEAAAPGPCAWFVLQTIVRF
jgi:hypothetical protein